MERKVDRYLKLFGINEISEVINKDINYLHRQKFQEILDSSLSKKEKAKKLNDLYVAKKIIENIASEMKNQRLLEKQNRKKRYREEQRQLRLDFINLIKNALPPKDQQISEEGIRQKQKNVLKLLFVGLPVFLIIFIPISNRISKNNNAKRYCQKYNYGVVPNKKDWGDIFTQNIYDGVYAYCLRLNGYKGRIK